ncbi:MAG: hypothetical protein HOV81_07360 [Kofleriaceae bacterium]|nr:hypothetical protein [Kofleriaceae bacterium]
MAGALAATAIGVVGVVRYTSRSERERERYEGREEREHEDEEENERFERPKPDSRLRHAGTHRAGPLELATRNRMGALESTKLQLQLAQGQIAKPSVPATAWVSLGPTDAPQQFNYYTIDSVDSGRPTSILVDPRDANVAYVATSGGGVWKTFDFLAHEPIWLPTTDTLPNLAAGAIALDAAHPDTIYLGSGDFIDGSGNTMFKSTNGGGTWSPAVVLEGMYPNQVKAVVSSINQIQVAGDVVWVATDAGLFRSSDAGATYALVDLPEAAGTVAETIWSIVPIGGGGWVASGVGACSVSSPAPGAFGLSDPNPQQGCPLGTNAKFWRTDDGTTWTEVTALPQTTGTNRTMLAVGPTTNPATTVVYAFVGDLFGSSTLGYWRSKDGGRTWTQLPGALANPTLVDPNQDDTCIDLNVGHEQSWYNQAIVVDPTNADHVLVGGNLCGVRTLNGTADVPVWENVSHWLPGTGYGETAGGRLSYVHADWHTATSIAINGAVRTIVGSDGGVFVSTNVFTAAKPEQVVWKHHNKGLATHLFYSVVSGDPATGNPFVLYGGLQDNGTRFRASPDNPSGFNQAVGGDGIGGTLHTGQDGTTYWASIQFQWAYCKPAVTDCSVEQPEAQSEEESHWHRAPSPVGLEPEQVQARAYERLKRFGEDDQAPFLVHYSNVETDTVGQSVLTHTDEQVFVAVPAGDGFTWKSISQDLTSSQVGAGISNITASRATPGLYGAVGLVSAEPFYVTTAGNTKVNWTVAQPVRVNGARLTGASSIDFPPTLEPGQQPGQVYIGAFTGTLNSPSRPPPPDELGRLWRTTDGGQTWTSIVGSDPARRLPNVPIYVVKYDPITASTIYAGTDLGVYITLDGGATWDRMGTGFPMVPVRDMYVARNQDFIRVATYGRGVWEIYPSAGAHHGAPGNGDYDQNLQLDWIDLGAMAARQGVTPEQTVAPLYSWIMDITGNSSNPVQAIDAEDLSAFLAKFGGHP